MKSFYVAVIVVAIIVGGAVAGLNSRDTTTSAESNSLVQNANNAAFRDGLFLGGLDGSQGNRPHFSSGRWSTDAGRASYIHGYQTGYRSALAKRSAPAVDPAEFAGYRDGMWDGASDRSNARPFHAAKTGNYQRASHGYAEVSTQRNQHAAAYRQAYSNGYQAGYYYRQLERMGSDQLAEVFNL